MPETVGGVSYRRASIMDACKNIYVVVLIVFFFFLN